MAKIYNIVCLADGTSIRVSVDGDILTVIDDQGNPTTEPQNNNLQVTEEEQE